MVALGNWVTTSRRLCWLGWQSFSNRTRRHRRNGCDLEERVTSEKLLLEPFCEGGGSSSDSTVNTEAQAAPGGAPGWQVALRTVPLKRITGLCISPDISEAALSFFMTWAKTSTTAGGALLRGWLRHPLVLCFSQHHGWLCLHNNRISGLHHHV